MNNKITDNEKILRLKQKIIKNNRSRYIRKILVKIDFTLEQLKWIDSEFPRRKKAARERRKMLNKYNGKEKEDNIKWTYKPECEWNVIVK